MLHVRLSEIPTRYASPDRWIEDWLADDVSVLDRGISSTESSGTFVYWDTESKSV